MTALAGGRGVACLAGTFDYDALMPTLTQLLERGKDDAIGRNEVEVLVGSVAEMDRLVGVPTGMSRRMLDVG